MTEAIGCWQTESLNMLLLANVSVIMSFILSFLLTCCTMFCRLCLLTLKGTYSILRCSPVWHWIISWKNWHVLLLLSHWLEPLWNPVVNWHVQGLRTRKHRICCLQNWTLECWMSFLGDDWQGLHTLACSIDCFLCLLWLNLFLLNSDVPPHVCACNCFGILYS